jgi:hypothetical protein
MIDFPLFPLWLIFLVSIVLLFVASEAGRLLARRINTRDDNTSATLEAAVLGLLALMISFTFAMALSRFDARRDALLNEANAIGTTALRARLLPAPHNTESLNLLREYTQLRLDAARKVRSTAELNAVIDRSNAIQEALWQQVKAVAAQDNAMVPTGLFIQTLNEMIDNHQKRLTAFHSRVPSIVLIALYGIAIVAAGFIGYASNLESTFWRLPVYVMSILLAAIILLIQDLDRPGAGFVMVNQQPMIDTANSLAGYKD